MKKYTAVVKVLTLTVVMAAVTGCSSSQKTEDAEITGPSFSDPALTDVGTSDVGSSDTSALADSSSLMADAASSQETMSDAAPTHIEPAKLDSPVNLGATSAGRSH